MAATITERPYKYCFSRNEIRYVFTVDNLTRPGLYLQIKILYHNVNSSVGIEMPALKLKPNVDGTVYFNIQQYIDSVLNYVLPNTATPVTNASEQCCKFYVHYRDISEADPIPVYTTTEENNKIIAIKGGISKEKFSRNNFFINYLNDVKPFFTWQPSARFVFLNQPLFLSSFITDGSINGYTLICNVVTIDDDSWQQVTNLPNDNGYFFHINLNTIINDLNAYRLVSIEFQVLDSNGNIIVDFYKLNFQYRPIYKYYDFIFHNSIGGIDTVRIRGEVEQGIDKQYEETEGGFKNDEALSIYKNYELKHSSITFMKTYKGDVGFLNTKNEQDAMIELLISRSIYQIKDSRYIPILNIQKSMPLRKNSDELFSFAIDFTTSIKEENFTPDFVNLGIGDLTD